MIVCGNVLHGSLRQGDLYIGLLEIYVLAVTDIALPDGEAVCTTGAAFIKICLCRQLTTLAHTLW